MSSADNASYNFSTGLDSNANGDTGVDTNSISASLMGPNAGASTSGVSSGAQNGNYSFAMPGSSMTQLQSQSLNPTALSNALAAGAKVSQPQPSPRAPAGPAHVRLHQAVFSSPITNFAGSLGGTDAGNSLIELLSKYHPGA